MTQEVIKKVSKLKGKSNAIISNILVYRKMIKTLIDKSSQPNLIRDSSYLQTEVVTKQVKGSLYFDRAGSYVTNVSVCDEDRRSQFRYQHFWRLKLN